MSTHPGTGGTAEAVQGALGVAYGTDVAAVAAAWESTFRATTNADQEAEEAGSINRTPDAVFSETTPPAPVDGDTEPPLEDPAVVHLDLLTPQETNAAAMGAARMWRIRRGQTPVGFVWRTDDAHQKWAGARADADGGLGDIASLSPTVHRTRKSVVDHLLDPASSYFTARSTQQQPPAEGTDTEARAVAVLLTGDPDDDHPYLWVHVDGERIGHLGKRHAWDLVEGWAHYSRPTDEELRTLSTAELGGRLPEAVTTLTGPAAAVRELLPQVLEEGVYIGSLHGHHTSLKVRPKSMDRWELYQGRVPGRYDVYTGSTCHGWLQPATGGGHTAHTTAGPVPGGPHPTREEAVVALWAHLTAPLPPPALGERARTKRRVRPPRDARPLCPYTPEELARVRLVRDKPDVEHSPYRAESPVDMRVLGYVWRKDAKRWSYAPADPDTGRPPEYIPALPTAATRAAALERLLSRPGPLWADPASQILHPPGHADTPAPDPDRGAVVDMTERIGPGWALHREGEADAHTWLVTYEGQVRGMVRRYRPRGGGLSRGWEALAGAGGAGGFLRRSATQQGKFGARSSFLWRSRDLAAWGIATDPPFAQPNPAWARRRPSP